MRRALALAASTLVALALLAALFSQVDGLFEKARSARPAWVAALLLAFSLNHGLRIVRWHALLRPARPLARTAAVCCVAFLAISVLPFRLGEVVRPTLHARDGVPLGQTLAAVVVERLLDLAALLVLLVAVTASADLVVDGVELAGLARRTATVGALGLAGALVAAVALGPRLAGVPVLGPVAVSASGAATDLLRDPRRATLGAALTAATWASTVVYTWCALHLLPGLPASLGAATVAWTGVIAAITALPTPGFFGSYEAGFAAGMALYGAPLDLAATAGLGMHVLYLAFVAIAGAPFAVGEASRA
jgi:glycosyltransferase 2 family protein